MAHPSPLSEESVAELRKYKEFCHQKLNRVMGYQKGQTGGTTAFNALDVAQRYWRKEYEACETLLQAKTLGIVFDGEEF